MRSASVLSHAEHAPSAASDGPSPDAPARDAAAWTVLQNADVGIYSVSADLTHVLLLNPAMEKIFGCPRADFVAQPALWLQQIDPADRPHVGSPLTELRERGRACHVYRVLRPDGSHCWVLDQSRRVDDAAGRPQRYDCFFTDIDRRRQAELTLAEAETLLRAAFEQAAVGIAYVETTGRILRVNDKLCQIAARSRNDLLALDWRHLFESAALDDVDPLQSVTVGRQSHCRATCRIRFPGAGERWATLTASAARDTGAAVQHLILIVEDVTERLAADRALATSEARFRLLAENAADLISRHTLDGTFLYASPACERILGYTPEELLGRSVLEILHPVERQRRQAQLLSATEPGRSEIQSATIRCLTKQGRDVYLETTLRTIPASPAGGSLELLGVSRDVTERVLADLRLAQSEARLRVLTDNMLDIVVLVDGHGIITFVTPSVEKVTGYCPHDLVGTKALSLVHEGDRPELARQLRLSMKRMTETLQHRYRCRCADGRSVRLEAAIRLLYTEHGQLAGLVNSARDVSARLRLEEALRESEANLQALVESTEDFIASFDHELQLRTFNSTMARYFEAAFGVRLRKGMALEEGYPPPHAARSVALRRLLEAALAHGRQRAEMTLVDGRPVDLIFSPIEREGRVVGVSFFGRDITPHKQAQAALRALPQVAMRAQEEERRAFAHELHDSVVQDLAALKLVISAECSQKRIAPDGQAVARMLGRIDTILDAARDLAMRLRPSILDDLGLVAALRSHGNRVATGSGVELFVSAEMEPARLPPDVETAGFRIAQEAIANAVHHAGTTAVYLRIARQEDVLLLTIRDDGCGFDLEPARRRAAQTGHLGLSVMQQRAAAIGGHTDIVSSPGHGTTVTVHLPVGESRLRPRAVPIGCCSVD